MDRIFVDTGVWYAYFNTGDPEHGVAAGILADWEGRLLTTTYIFDELVTLVLSRVHHRAAVLAGRALRSGDLALMLTPEPADIETAWRLFERSRDKMYSFTDCVSFAVMRRLGLKTAATLDAHFRQAGFQVLPEGNT